MAKTLCDWSKSDIDKNLRKLAAIIGEPRFVCRKCARSASGSKYLCKPRTLPAEAPVEDPAQATNLLKNFWQHHPPPVFRKAESGNGSEAGDSLAEGASASDE